jgi:hypothetical protein
MEHHPMKYLLVILLWVSLLNTFALMFVMNNVGFVAPVSIIIAMTGKSQVNHFTDYADPRTHSFCANFLQQGYFVLKLNIYIIKVNKHVF